MVRVGNERLRMHRHPTILLEHGDGTQADAQGNSTTNRRMGKAEGDRTDSTRQVSCHRSDADVQQSIRPLQPGECVLVPGMLSLSVGKRVHFADRDDDVYELNDWPADDYRNARRGPWIRYAADRHRFKRRIQQTEQILCSVLTKSHRDGIRAELSIH